MPRHARKTTSISNSGGFTLIEVMVAIIILMVGLLALLQSINLSIVTNQQTAMRTQGTMIGEEHLAKIKSQPFDSLVDGEENVVATTRMRGTFVNYSVWRKIKKIDSDPVSATAKQIDVGVRWKHRGNQYEEHFVSVMTSSADR